MARRSVYDRSLSDQKDWGTCEERCPMGAIQVGAEDVAEVDESRCIGCGVCTPTCSNDAVDLVLRGEIEAPQQIQDFLAVRLKGA